MYMKSAQVMLSFVQLHIDDTYWMRENWLGFFLFLQTAINILQSNFVQLYSIITGWYL